MYFSHKQVYLILGQSNASGGKETRSRRKKRKEYKTVLSRVLLVTCAYKLRVAKTDES